MVVPTLAQLADSAEWVEYHRGLGHSSDSPLWNAPLHGLALPTANSLSGSVIADENILAVRSVTMPPYTSGPWSSVARNSSRLGRLSIGSAPLYTRSYLWTYTGFERRAKTADAEVRSTVRTPLSQPGVLFNVSVTPRTDARRCGPLRIDLLPEVRAYPASAINCSRRQWRYPANMDSSPCAEGRHGYCARNCWNWYAPRPFANESNAFKLIDASSRGRLLALRYLDATSGAVTAIAVQSEAEEAEPRLEGAALVWSDACERQRQLSIAVAFGGAADQASTSARASAWAVDIVTAMTAARDEREARFRAAFVPHERGGSGGHGAVSGRLPVLETQDVALRTVYYAGVASVLELQRTTAAWPHAPTGSPHAFISGAAENTSTNVFFWDQAYCATALAMLDPRLVRTQLLQWLQPQFGGDDARAGWGVDLYSGRAVGNHYAANDLALFKLALHYVQQSAEFGFLDERVSGRPVLDWMHRLATAYRNRTATGHAGHLADYGAASELLECVPTYAHRVAAFNAANVWMLESLADLLRARGRPGDAARAGMLRDEADAVAAAILSDLYVDGAGYWCAQSADGRRCVPVRHVIDFAYTSEFLGRRRLGSERHAQMNHFVASELLTGTWMRALSTADAAAAASDRTDHGPNGAYDGWPPLTIAAFARAGNHSLAADFLRRTSAVCPTGPYGQAHGVADPDLRSNTTYKPFEFTLANGMGGLDFVDAIVTAIFGLQPAHAISLSARPPPVADASSGRGVEARLIGVPWQGRLYDATASAAGVEWKVQTTLGADGAAPPTAA